jgi:hypothetical protein
MDTGFVTKLNSAVFSGETTVTLDKGDYAAGKAVVFVENKSGVIIDFCGSSISGERTFIEVKNSSVTIKNLNFTQTGAEDFAVRVSGGSAVIQDCTFATGFGAISVESAKVEIKKCTFSDVGKSVERKSNGILLYGDVDANISNCDFNSLGGDAVLIADNKIGTTKISGNSFKRCRRGIRSKGRTYAQITDNFFLVQSFAIGFFPSSTRDLGLGAVKVSVEYNLFDECALESRATIEAHPGETERFTHGEIRIENNVFAQKTRPVLYSDGVENLTFKSNNVRSEDENTVLNGFVNGKEA